jgi:hypothetical protein
MTCRVFIVVHVTNVTEAGDYTKFNEITVNLVPHSDRFSHSGAPKPDIGDAVLIVEGAIRAGLKKKSFT